MAALHVVFFLVGFVCISYSIHDSFEKLEYESEMFDSEFSNQYFRENFCIYEDKGGHICRKSDEGDVYVYLIICFSLIFIVFFTIFNVVCCCPCQFVLPQGIRDIRFNIPKNYDEILKEFHEFDEEVCWLCGCIREFQKSGKFLQKKSDGLSINDIQETTGEGVGENEKNYGILPSQEKIKKKKDNLDIEESCGVVCYVNLILFSFVVVVLCYSVCKSVDEILLVEGPFISKFDGSSKFDLHTIFCFKGDVVPDDFCVMSNDELKELPHDVYDASNLKNHPITSPTSDESTTFSREVCVETNTTTYFAAQFRSIQCTSLETGTFVRCTEAFGNRLGYEKYPKIIMKSGELISFKGEPYITDHSDHLSVNLLNASYDVELTQTISIPHNTYLEAAIFSFGRSLEKLPFNLHNIIQGYLESIRSDVKFSYLITTLKVSDFVDDTPRVRVSLSPTTIMMKRKTLYHCIFLMISGLFESFVIVGVVYAIRKPIVMVLRQGMKQGCSKQSYEWILEFFVILVAVVISLLFLIYHIIVLKSVILHRDQIYRNDFSFSKLLFSVQEEAATFPNIVNVLWFIVLEFLFLWRIRCCWSLSAIDCFSCGWWINMIFEPYLKSLFVIKKRLQCFFCLSSRKKNISTSCCFFEIVWICFTILQVYVIPRILIWGITSFFLNTAGMIIGELGLSLFDSFAIIGMSFLCCCNTCLRRQWEEEEFVYRNNYQFDEHTKYFRTSIRFSGKFLKRFNNIYTNKLQLTDDSDEDIERNYEEEKKELITQLVGHIDEDGIEKETKSVEIEFI